MATSPVTEFGVKDIRALHEALCPVSARYKFFGLQIGVDINEIKKIEANYKDSSEILLEILCSRLYQEPALTCADICKALRSQTVSMCQLANSFQSCFECQGGQHKVKNETERESSEKKKAETISESAIHFRMSEKESKDESKSQYAVVEIQIHKNDEPKSKRAKKKACKKENYQCTSEHPVSKSVIQLRMSKKESERSKRIESDDELNSDESEKSGKAEKSAEVERQMHERDEPKSKRAKKTAHMRERAVKKQCPSEQLEPDEYKEYYERKQMKGKQKQKVQFSEIDASPQSGAESDQKRNKSVKESEKIVHKIMSTNSENESSDACKEKETLSEITEKVRESAAYSKTKYQPQSAKIREVKNEARKKGKILVKEESTKTQHSVLHRKTAVAVESDEDTCEQPSHKSKKKFETEERESESTSDESETENPKHREKVKSKSPTDTEKMYDEEIEKVVAKDEKKMPQKFKVATAMSSPHSNRLVEEEQCKQKKAKRSVDMKDQERESELQAKANRAKLQKPYIQLKERERVNKTNSGIKAKRLVAHSSEQALDESQTDPENEESDSGNDSSEDGEDSDRRSSDEEEKTETDEEFSTAPREEEVKKKKKKEKSVYHKKEKAKKEGFEEERKLIEKEKRVSEAVVEQSKYDLQQGGRLLDETHTRKVKRERESEAASLKYDSSGHDEQSDPGHGSRDQEEHDNQQKRRKKKMQTSISPTAIGSSSPSTSQDDEKKQPVSKKQGNRKKHVRKMKEKSGYGRHSTVQKKKEVKNRKQGTLTSSSETESSLSEYVMLTKTEKKKLRTIFKCSFGKLCCAGFDPVATATLLQEKGLISKVLMEEMIMSPESQQAKIIGLVKALDRRIKSRPDKLFVCIDIFLKSDALHKTGKDMLNSAG